MTRDDLTHLLRENDIPALFRLDCFVPGKIRLFCREVDRFVVEDLIWKFMPLGVWVGIITEYYDYRHYTPPKSTISDHLNDCFGFWFYNRHDRFNEFVDAFHKALLREMRWLKGMGV